MPSLPVPRKPGTRLERTFLHFMPADFQSLLTAEPEADPVTPRRAMNRKIKAADSLPRLLLLLQREGPAMDHANVSHCLQRLSRLFGEQKVTRGRTQADGGAAAAATAAALRTQYVAPALVILDQLVGQHIASFEPWDVALCIWGYGNLGHGTAELLPQLCGLARQHASHFQPIDCVQVRALVSCVMQCT